jgi:hypothetical protein
MSSLWISASLYWPRMTIAQRARRAVVGERWTAQMEQDYQNALPALARARERLAQRARAVLSKPSVELFGHETPVAEGALPSVEGTESNAVS